MILRDSKAVLLSVFLFTVSVAALASAPAKEWRVKKTKLPAEASSPILLTATKTGLREENSFTCSGKIHGHVSLPQEKKGRHVLEGIWRLPNGEVAEHSYIPVHLNGSGLSSAHFQLNFPRRGVVNQSAENRRTLSGRWRLEVLLDYKPFAHEFFQVQCS